MGRAPSSRWSPVRPPSLDPFLEFVGLIEDEFTEIALSHQVSPYRHGTGETQPARQLHDYAAWSRDGAMPRIDAEELDARWRARQRDAA